MLTDFALENAKLIMLFALIGTIIGLSHLDANKLAALKAALNRQLWRGSSSVAYGRRARRRAGLPSRDGSWGWSRLRREPSSRTRHMRP